MPKNQNNEKEYMENFTGSEDSIVAQLEEFSPRYGNRPPPHV